MPCSCQKKNKARLSTPTSNYLAANRAAAPAPRTATPVTRAAAAPAPAVVAAQRQNPYLSANAPHAQVARNLYQNNRNPAAAAPTAAATTVITPESVSPQ